MSISSASCSAAAGSSNCTAGVYLTVSPVIDPVRNYIPNSDSLNDFIVYRRYYADYCTVTKREATEPSKQTLPSTAAHHVRQYCKASRLQVSTGLPGHPTQSPGATAKNFNDKIEIKYFYFWPVF